MFPIRLRLRSKMLAGFCALAVLTAVLGGYALLALERTN